MTTKNTNKSNAQRDQETPSTGRTRTRGREQDMDLRASRRAANANAGRGRGGQARQGQGGGGAQGGQQDAQGQGDERQEIRAAWEDFLDDLEPVFQEVGDSVRVIDRAGWVKVENNETGHKLYFNKGVTGVTRVESSLAPDAVKGAQAPEFYNGRITSIIPPTVEAVSEAIRVISQVADRLSPPRRRTRDME